MIDLSGIKGDLKTTVPGAVVILATLGLIFQIINLDTWLSVAGFALGGGLVLTNSQHPGLGALIGKLLIDAGPPEALKPPGA